MKVSNNPQLSFFNVEANGNSYNSICSAISDKEFLTPDEFGSSLKASLKKIIGKPINILALFSGAGGLDIGFCDAGFKLIESVEIEDKFVKTMLFNQERGEYFQSAKIRCQDIREYQPNLDCQIDFIIGGPPCQSFSAAGRRAAGVAGTKDDRGNLFEEYVRILNIVKPKGFLFENVYGLLGAEKGESIKKIVNAFKQIGYTISYRILDAADYGVPQHRERLIIVGSKSKKFKFPKPTHGPDSLLATPHYSALQALENLTFVSQENAGVVNGRFGHLLKEVPPGLNYSFFTEKMGHPTPIFAWRSKFSDFLYKADPNTPIRTLKASGGQYTGPFHWENRHFNVEELKRLQTFPDNYTIVGNKAIASKQIGNSVPPQFARILAVSVLDQFFDIALPFKLKYLEEMEKLTFRKLKGEKTEKYLGKAVAAINQVERLQNQRIIKKKFRVELNNNFKMSVSQDSKVEVEFIPKDKKWFFKLKREGLTEDIFQIDLHRGNNMPMFLNVTEICLLSNSNIPTDYTLLWKVFEQVLAENQIKADLVQFNGYYQYRNDIKFDLIRKSSSKLRNTVWKVLELILKDSKIGQIRTINQFSVDYGIDKDSLVDCFYQLREMGFEIRNSNTNSEIEENEFLIPYRFPTLTPLSVQLKKSLQSYG